MFRGGVNQIIIGFVFVFVAYVIGVTEDACVVVHFGLERLFSCRLLLLSCSLFCVELCRMIIIINIIIIIALQFTIFVSFFGMKCI